MSNPRKYNYTPITDNESACAFLFALGFKLVHTPWQPDKNTPRELACALRWAHHKIPMTYCARHDSEWLATQIALWIEETPNLTIPQVMTLLKLEEAVDWMQKEAAHVFHA